VLMASDMRMALDPALIGERVGLVLDPWQAELIRTQPRRCLMLAARQSGKSTATALLALHVAIFQPGSLILLLSPSQRQSQELFRTLMLYHGKLEGAPELTAESLLRAELSNGSRIIALPGGGEGKTVRGYAAVKLAVVDEAARCEDGLFAVVRPMLGTSDGSLIMLSTPFGKRGEFHRAWTEGGQDWTRLRIPASECPRLSKEFLAEELRELGAQRFSEEYELAFLEPDESIFPTAIIDRAFTADVRPLWS
jgi:Terminase large subunit, T4likevirus-type, N-terminal